MTSLVLLAILTQDPKVSLEIRGERLIVCAPKIAQALGMPQLHIRAPFQEEVAAIRVVNVDRQTLKQKIEQAFRGTFIQKEGEWLFEQTPEQKTQEKTEHFKMRLTKEQEFIDGAKEVVSQYKPFTKATAESLQKAREADGEMVKVPWKGDNQWQTPLGRFVVEIISRMSVGLWHDVDHKDQRVVFSIKPTAMQRSMPFPIEDLISKFLANQSIFASVMKGHFDKNGMESVGGWVSIFEPLNRNDLHHVNLVISADLIEVRAFSAQGGKTLQVTQLSLDEFKDGSGNGFDPAYKHPEIKYSALSKEYKAHRFDESLFSDWRTGSKGPEASPQLRYALLNPESIDPLSFMVPEALFDSNRNRNIVANIYPRLLHQEDLSKNACDLPSPGGEFWKCFVYEGDWVILKLPNPYLDRMAPQSRARMGSAMRRFIEGPYPTLEEQAAIPELCQTTGDLLLSQNLALLMRGRATMPPASCEFLRLFGSLSEFEKTAAKRQPMSLGKLNETFLKTLHEIVFNHKLLFPDVNVYEKAGVYSEEVKRRDREIANFIYGLGSEPTFRHPVGLHTQMELRIREEHSAKVILTRKTAAKPGAIEIQIDTRELGALKFFADLPPSKRSRFESHHSLANYDVNTIRIIGLREVRLVVDTNLGFEYGLLGSQPLSLSSGTYTLDTLPAAIAKEVEEGYAMTKRMFERAENETQRPPPPVPTFRFP